MAGELAAAAQMSPPAMSRHLRVLRGSGVVEVTTDAFGWDYAECTDDQGSAFGIGWVHPEMDGEQLDGLGSLPSPRAGLGYLTIGAPDVDRAESFFHGLSGWHVDDATSGSVDEGRYRRVTGTTLPSGASTTTSTGG